MLLLFPVFAAILFASQGVRRGVIYGGLIGYLFLPTVAIDLPGLPPLDKNVAVGFSLFFGAYLARDRDRTPPVSSAPWVGRGVWTCAVLFLVGAVITWLNNTQPIQNGGARLPGLGPRDVLALMVPALSILPTMLVARRHLAAPEAHRDLCAAIVIIGLGYALLALVEVRLSPQMNLWVYGYFPHSWIQHLRGGSWRPVVFLDHGLSLGFFLTTAVLCCGALVRSGDRGKTVLWTLVLTFLLGVLVLSRNVGALGLCVLFLPMVLMASQRMQLRVAVIVAWAFALYPLVRSFGLLPYARFLEFVKGFSEDRAQSFMVRLVNEDRLLDRALEKPITGWGGWARARIYDAFGNDITISDGLWVIRLGDHGLIGFISMFGPLLLAIFALSRLSKSMQVGPTTTVFAIVTAANLIYIVPNSTLTPIAWLMAGSLIGLVEFGRQGDSETKETSSVSNIKPREAPRYSRFSQDANHRALRREL